MHLRPLAMASLLLATVPLYANLPDGPGRQDAEKLCVGCHDMAQSVSLRQDRNGWAATVLKMVGLGVKGTDDELLRLVDYLAKHFPAGQLPPIDVNTARAIQLESRLSLKRSEAAAIMRYRKEHGKFESLEELLSVPGVDTAKIEAKRNSLVFK